MDYRSICLQAETDRSLALDLRRVMRDARMRVDAARDASTGVQEALEAARDAIEGWDLPIPGAYTAIGPVRGWCGHRHDTIEGARACAQDDATQVGARGYSDRRVYRWEDLPKRVGGEPYLAWPRRAAPVE